MNNLTKTAIVVIGAVFSLTSSLAQDNGPDDDQQKLDDAKRIRHLADKKIARLREAKKEKEAAERISPELFEVELAKAQADIELLRRALRRKKDAERTATAAQKALKESESKIEELKNRAAREVSEREKRIKVLETRIEETQKKLEDGKGNASDLEQLRGEFDAKIKELNAAQKNTVRFSELLTAEVKKTEELKEKADESQGELDAAREELKKLTAKTDEEKKKLEEEKKKFETEKNDLGGKLKKANEEIDKLKKSADDYKKKLEEAIETQNNAFALMKRDRKLKEQAVAKNAELTKKNEESEKTLERLQAEKAAAEKEISELKKQLASSKGAGVSSERIAELEQKVAAAAALTEKHTKLEAERATALQQLIEAGSLIQQLATQRDAAKAKLATAEASQKEAEGKATASLEKSLAAALDGKKSAESERDALKKQLKSDAEISKEIKDACELAEKNLAKLKDELSEGNKIADTLGGKLRTAAETLAKLRTEKEHADSQIAALTAQLKSERKNYRSELAAVRGELERVRQSNSARQNALVDAGAFINELITKRKGDERQRFAAEKALEEAGDLIGELLARQTELESELTAARKLIDSEKAGREGSAHELAGANTRIGELESALNETRKQLRENQAALAQAQKDTSGVTAKRLAAETTLYDTSRLLSDLVKNQNALKGELTKTSEALNAEKTGRGDDQKALENARQQFADLTSKLEDQTKAAADAARNATVIAAAMAALKDEKGNSDRKLAELQATADAGKAANAELTTKFESSQKALAEKTKELDGLKVAFTKLEDQRGAAVKALDESNEVIRELLAAKEACDVRIADFTALSERQASELADTRKQLETEQEAKAAALSVKAETENQLAALAKELEARKAALESTKQSAIELTNQLNLVSSAKDSASAERTSLQEALAAETARTSTLQTRVDSLREELATKSTEIGRLDAMLDKSTASGETAKGTLLKSAEFIQNLIDQRDKDRQEFEHSRRGLLSDVGKVRSDLAAQLAALQAAGETVNEQKLALEQEVATLSSELKQARSEGAKSAGVRADITKQLTSARQKIAALEDRGAELDKLHTYANSVESSKAEAETALKEAAVFIGELIARRDQDTGARDQAEKALHKLKNDFNGVEKQAEKLRQKLNDLEQLKIKKTKAEERLTQLEEEKKKAEAEVGKSLTVVQELHGARAEALSARSNAELAFQAAAEELERLKTEITRNEKEYRRMLSKKEHAWNMRLGEQQQMLVIANTRLGEVDGRLHEAMTERRKAEKAADDAISLLAELREERGTLDGKIKELSRLLDDERNGRAKRKGAIENLRAQLEEAEGRRTQVNAARIAAEKNAAAMGKILAEQAKEIDASRELAKDFKLLQASLNESNAERDQMAAQLEEAAKLNQNTQALKEELAAKETECQQKLASVLNTAAESDQKLAALQVTANQTKKYRAELDRFKNNRDGSLDEAIERAAFAGKAAIDEKLKAEMYQKALNDSEASVELLARKVREVDVAYKGALGRIKDLETSLNDARDDKKKALAAALDVKERLLRIDPIWYALNSSSIEEERARALKQAKAIIAQYPGANFRVGGHTCTIGSPAANQQLSQTRAQGLADFLSANGIAKSQITASGFGPSKPIGDNATEEGRRRNRRVEIDVDVE
jgi:outer membrane protein OmpA-like peptidoglycan-associated protein/DNA repair exonuclease SbcCD ATPase subunit